MTLSKYHEYKNKKYKRKAINTINKNYSLIKHEYSYLIIPIYIFNKPRFDLAFLYNNFRLYDSILFYDSILVYDIINDKLYKVKHERI